MGLTREMEKSLHKKDSYERFRRTIENHLKLAEAQRQRDAELRTIGMLLDAYWNTVLNKFVKTVTDHHGNRSYQYFTRNGERCTRDGEPLEGEEGEIT